MRKQWCARDQSLDKFDNFWIDLNETTVIRPKPKAQIYSVNEKLTSKRKTYQQTKSLECEASLISLKELAEKKKDGEVADEKVNCK